MKSHERYITSDSDYYIYTPSLTAKNLFFYPTLIGCFRYEPGYSISRNRFDSFLLMLITEGSCDLTLAGRHFTASKGQLVLADCYAPHQYGTSCGWQCLWFHFDGRLARDYYNAITGNCGNVIMPRNFQSVKYLMEALFKQFKAQSSICESQVSTQITTLLNDLLAQNSRYQKDAASDPLKDSIAYINEHFSEPLSLSELAKKASLSPFYFTRIFTQETGLTPYQYLIATRISFAKYLLKTTSLPIKEIAFSCGFTSESSFCSSFKKHEAVTPTDYRLHL